MKNLGLCALDAEEIKDRIKTLNLDIIFTEN